jgi:hypothetical protein
MVNATEASDSGESPMLSPSTLQVWRASLPALMAEVSASVECEPLQAGLRYIATPMRGMEAVKLGKAITLRI